MIYDVILPILIAIITIAIIEYFVFLVIITLVKKIYEKFFKRGDSNENY